MFNKKRILARVLLIAALMVAGLFFIRPHAHSQQLTGVKEIILSPIDVEIPPDRSQLYPKPAITGTGYEFRVDGNRSHLNFVHDGTSERVLGEMPIFTANPDRNVRGFTEVVSPAGNITYFRYTKYEALPIDGAKLVASELYALKGNRVKKILPSIQPGGIDPLDRRRSSSGTYLDQRGYLYALTSDGTLCVIRDGQIIAKADVSKLGAKLPAIPSMFSDAENTYFIVPKLTADGQNMLGGTIKGKYKINF